MAEEKTQELEINGMETTSSLPAKSDDLADIEPIMAEVRNQQTGEFEKVMISPHDIREYICPTATLSELYIFMSICRNQGIDPISEAYFVKFGDLPGFTVMKYTVYLKRAMQSGVLKSIRHEFDDEENPTKIMVYIQRNDMEGEWVWTTYRSNVEKRRKSDGKVTEIWATQLQFMMVKCGYSQGLRFFCADVVGALPPTQEEMPGIGAMNVQSPITGAATGMLAEASETEPISGEILEVKSVEPLPEHLDMGPLRIAFHEMIAGKFADDDARHKWQMQHTGVASMKEWGPAEYAKAFKAIAREEAATGNDDPVEATQDEGDPADPHYHSGPDTNIGAQTEEEQAEPAEPTGPKPEEAERTFYTEANKRFKTMPDMSIWCKSIISEKPYDKWDVAEFQIALPVLMEVPLLKDQKGNEEEPMTKDGIPVDKSIADAVKEGTLEVAKSHFLDMLAERIPNHKVRGKWIAENMPDPVSQINSWEHHRFEYGIKLLSEMSSESTIEPRVSRKAQEDVQNGQDTPKESTQEPDNDVGDYGMLITSEMKGKINTALLNFPGLKYKTIRSMALRKMACEAIGHDYTDYNKLLNSDGRLILAALAEEKSEILLAEVTSEPPLDDKGEPVVTGEVVAGEITNDDPLGQGEESKGDLLELYLEKAGERFADKSSRKTWEQDQELPFDLSIAKWPESEIKRGYAMLEKVTKLANIPNDDPPMNEGQLGEMQVKISDMHEKFHNSLGSQEFLNLVFSVTKPNRKVLRDLTEAEADEVIMEMTDAVDTEKARKKAAPKASE